MGCAFCPVCLVELLGMEKYGLYRFQEKENRIYYVRFDKTRISCEVLSNH